MDANVLVLMRAIPTSMPVLVLMRAIPTCMLVLVLMRLVPTCMLVLVLMRAIHACLCYRFFFTLNSIVFLTISLVIPKLLI